MSDIQKVPVITIDGPSGTGKGTICHKLARYLGWHILDSGLIYRVLALSLQKQANKDLLSVPVDNIVSAALKLDVRFALDSNKKNICVILENSDVTNLLRSEQCGQDASKIAALPEVRSALLERQRAFAQQPGLVTDGRDMGTVVFPNAIFKLYLDASLDERSKRRYDELISKGYNVDVKSVKDELEERDTRDKTRSTAPMLPASDAVIIDTSGLSVAQVFKNVLKCLAERNLVKH